MAEVEYMVLAEHVIVENDKVSLLNGFASGFFAESFPFHLKPMQLIVMLKVTREELAGFAHAVLSLTGVDGKVMGDALAEGDMPFSQSPVPSPREHEYQRIVVSIPSITFIVPGTYELVLFLGGVEKKRISLRISKDPMFGPITGLAH